MTKRGAFEDAHLPFEGFLEAICRLAAQKALPTDGELESWAAATGAEPDAGAYNAYLEYEKRDAYNEHVLVRKVEWCGFVPPEGFERRVHHTISLFYHAVARCGE